MRHLAITAAMSVLGACAAPVTTCVEGEAIAADLTVVSGATREHIEGVRISSTHPPECSDEVTDDRGRAVLEVPANTDVGFRLTHEDHLGVAIQLTVADEDFGGSVPIITNSEATIVLAALGTRIIRDEGLVVVVPDRAEPEAVRGVNYRLVNVASGEEYAGVYLAENGLPSEAMVTGPDGRALFAAIPVGRYRLHSELFLRCAIVTGWTSGGGLDEPDPWVEVEVISEAALVLVVTGCHAP